jgi:1-acyl-sn-glycerol-3-phosphate acyltransferase
MSVQYPLHKLGLSRRPMFTDHQPESQHFLGLLLKWKKRLRVVGAEHCPQEDPAVFASNHLLVSDPLFAWEAVKRATQQRICIAFMMRDDFFQGFPWNCLPVSGDSLAEMGGTVLISRDKVQLSQLRPLLNVLGGPGSFAMYPGRTRSRTGLVFEYRDGVTEPGSISFFQAQIQRKHPELRVAAVPMMRLYNPVNKGTTIVFGEALYLNSGAKRQEQRSLDFELVSRIGALVEIGVPHVVSGLLYLRCLHQRGEQVAVASLTEAVRKVLLQIEDHHIDPAAISKLDTEIEATLAYFANKDMLTREGEIISLKPDLILSAPEPDREYKRKNPVKFQLNQILHLSDVVAHIETAERNW